VKYEKFFKLLEIASRLFLYINNRLGERRVWMKRSDCVVFGFSFMGIVFCMLLSFLFINRESTFTLVIFDLLFVSLTFPLDGKLIYKACLLLMGNILGSFWNYLFSSFSSVGTYYLGDFFNALCTFISPFANLVWIVSFWSMSLTLLANSKKEGETKI